MLNSTEVPSDLTLDDREGQKSRSLYRVAMGLTLDNLKKLNVKSQYFDSKYLENGGPNESHIGKHPLA